MSYWRLAGRAPSLQAKSTVFKLQTHPKKRKQNQKYIKFLSKRNVCIFVVVKYQEGRESKLHSLSVTYSQPVYSTQVKRTGDFLF
jgi:hypothetical protein